MGSLWTKEIFQKRLKLMFPSWENEIIEYNGFKKPLIIKCKNCQKTLEFSQASRIFSRLNACSCKKEFKNYIDKLTYLGTQFNFKIDNLETIHTSKVITTCLNCGTQQVRSAAAINLAPYHCAGCSNHKDSELSISQEKAQGRLDRAFPNEYVLLEYAGVSKPALLRHKCGFVFKTTKLSELINQHNKGCPKCKKTKSKGEEKIQQYLDDNKIEYIAQKTFLPDGKKYYYRFDFYLPKYNMAIEYQGEQHFRDNGFAREGLKVVQEKDNIKREYCQKNNISLLEIPYTNLKNIEEILSSKFNDYDENQ